MTQDLNYFTGVSWTRSGHHLLARLLSAYFDERFGYCEHYTPKNCCRQVPCINAGEINLSKNHDFQNVVPISNDTNYLVQFRKFLPSLVSNYELHIRTQEDSRGKFKVFAENEAVRFKIFTNKWAEARKRRIFIEYITYEDITQQPEASLERAIKLFVPQEKINKEKIRHAIAQVQFVTVEKGVDRIELAAGVTTRRDITAFRHYDENHFKKLAAQTDPFHERLLSAAKESASDTSLPYRAHYTAANQTKICAKMYLDITGPIVDANSAHTGIPRVELFIARQAVADPDGDVQVVLYDRQLKRYRVPTSSELSGLDAIKADPTPADPPKDTIRLAFSHIRANPSVNRSFDRHWASNITGRQQGEIAYALIKNVIRAYRLLQKVRRRKNSTDQFVRREVDLTSGPFLLSHVTTFGSLYNGKLEEFSQPVFICHDLIPWLNPDLTIGKTHAKRFVSQLSEIVRSGALALCTSETSRSMLEQFVSENSAEQIEIKQFPLPSILFEFSGRVESPASPSRLPYILYCSTIEARKNHLMLAEIWKRSLDAGEVFPKLICAGKWGWGVEELKNFLSRNPELEKCIQFTGFISDPQLIDLYRGALFGVMPSRMEGWGFGVSECLDFGVPVIVSTTPALIEASKGLMPSFDPADQDGWYEQIRRWSTQPSELHHYKQKINEHYQPITCKESWLAIKIALKNASRSQQNLPGQ